jgi:hypothetical protein
VSPTSRIWAFQAPARTRSCRRFQFRDDPAIVLRGCAVDKRRRNCFIDRGREVVNGHAPAWRADGPITHPAEIDIRFRKPVARAFELAFSPIRSDAFGGVYFGNWSMFDVARLRDLRRVLMLARRSHWRLVGFLSPYSSRYAAELQGDPRLASRVADFRGAIPSLYARFGFRFVDSLDAVSIGCNDKDFVDDGWHPDAHCSERLRRRLDAEAMLETNG